MNAPSKWERLPGLMAAALIVAILLQGSWAWRSLSPDGVANLDLADRLQGGEWRAFVQGYWSPLLPTLVVALAPLTGSTPIGRLIAAHVVNVIATITAILLIVAWGRRRNDWRFTIAALGALMLVSNGFPRVEAVTPDVLSLLFLAWLGYELLGREGGRWIATGLVMGLIFLARTSAWPWLLLTLPVRLWATSGTGGRSAVWRSTALAFGIALLWLVPLGIREGHPTVGSTARLNFAWYLDGSDARTPDTHAGSHTHYHLLASPGGPPIEWAEISGPPGWTYAPWSDPTTWDAGVITRAKVALTPRIAFPYWFREARITFTEWLAAVLLAVLLPWWFLEWTPEMRRRPPTRARMTYGTALIALIGICQFLAVHAEPRLVAPPALLAVLALLHGPSGEGSIGEGSRSRWRICGTIIVLVTVTSYAGVKLSTWRRQSAAYERYHRALAAQAATLADSGLSQSRVVLVGPAMEIVAGAYVSGVHIVAQVPPSAAILLMGLPDTLRARALATIAGPDVDVAWITKGDGVIHPQRIIHPPSN